MSDRLVRNSAKCLGCGDEIVSEHRHDFTCCTCGALCVDGGLAYTRRLFAGAVGWEETSKFEGDS